MPRTKRAASFAIAPRTGLEPYRPPAAPILRSITLDDLDRLPSDNRHKIEAARDVAEAVAVAARLGYALEVPA